MAVRQLDIALAERSRLAIDDRNPRRADIVANRGSIIARDGTPLALSRAGKRVYPLGSAAAHAVGYASVRYGTFGLEGAYDRVLTARLSGSPLAEVRSLFPGASPSRGSEIVTTLDVVVQRTLASALARHARAAGVVLDPRSGAVLALASTPGFDPNTLDRDFNRLRTAPQSPLLDRATDGLYPPGSTFKIVTAAAGLAAGTVAPSTVFVDTGGFKVGNFIVRNDENEVTGRQDLTGAFALSSNVDFAQVAVGLGVDRWFAAMAQWEIGQSLEFDLPAARDRLPERAEVSPSVLAQLGFGEASLLVTPLRMALVAATIANDGVTPRPYLVRSVAGAETTLATHPEQLARPIDEATARTVRAMMVAVVQRGTGTAAALPGVTVAGKTGTATNPHGLAHSWFVAFAPADAPRVCAAVVVENAGYGAAVSAPIVRELLRVALARTRT